VEEIYNWFINEYNKDISLYHNKDQNYYSTITDYYKNPILYGYLLYSPTSKYIGKRNYTLQKAVDFTKVNAAWRIPYKNIIHDHSKTKIDNIIERGYFCRLVETDAVFIKNIMDDILKNRKREAESANNGNDYFTRYFRETDYNGYLSEPVFRSQMRFKAWSVNHLADELKQQWLTRPYVFMRTHTKNPYVKQNLISLNSDSLYDSAINSIRPTLPALFITGTGELCYVDMFTAKARKKLPTPDNMMGYYQLLNLNGEVITPQEIICNYSFRKQTASSIFDTNYLFIYNETATTRRCLVTNSNLVPLYDIDFFEKEIIEGASTLTINPKITGCGQLTLPDYWYDPCLLNEEHSFNNYSYYGDFKYIGKLLPEFNEDATAYNYDLLEFLKERRVHNLNKDATDVAEFIKSIIDTDAMENTEQTVCQETTDGTPQSNITEYKYPKLNKIYYYDSVTKQRAFRYDPASQENEPYVQIASICGLTPVESLVDLSSYVLYSTNDSFLTSYETYANFNDSIDVGPIWFFWGVTAATDAGPWSTSYPSSETLILTNLQVLSTSSAGDVISQSKENDPDTGNAVLTDAIMTLRVTVETQKLQYMLKKGIVVEENADGEKYFVKYDVNIITAPRCGLYSGNNEVVARFKVQRYTGVNFDTLTESSVITLYNGYGAKTTVSKYENTKDYFRFLYYLDSYTEVKDGKYTNNYRIYSENVKIYSRIKEDITIRKTIAPGTIYDRGDWEYPGYTWKYDPDTKTFETKSIKKDFDYIKPLYYYTNTLTELTSTYNQPNIISKVSFDRLGIARKSFVSSCTNVGEMASRQYGFNESVKAGLNSTEFKKIDRLFSHGILLNNNDFYTFKQQPCHASRIPSDNPYVPSEYDLYADPQTSETKAYPRLNSSIHSATKLFAIEQEKADITDEENNEISSKKLIATGWDFSLEPPKSLIHPIPTQFTLIGPCYHSPVQAAAFKQFTTDIGSSGGGYPYYGGSVSLYTDDHMMIYYIPSDPILDEDIVSTIGSSRTLDFHFKGIDRGLQLSNKERFMVLTESSNFSGFIDLVNEEDPSKEITFPDSRLLRFSTNARFGLYRLKIKDDLEITKNPKTGEAVLRVDQSPLIKIWPRTLPIKYQQDTDGVFQKVSDWKLGFLPAPKSNYHLRFFRKQEPDELINLEEPFDPQYGIMTIKKIESTKTGDNDLSEVSMEVSFWNIAYGGAPYIPKSLSKNKQIVVEFNGVGSYPYYWYVVNTNKTETIALLLPYVEDGKVNKKKKKLVTLGTAGKFKLCVTDGAGIFYASSEIEIK